MLSNLTYDINPPEVMVQVECLSVYRKKLDYFARREWKVGHYTNVSVIIPPANCVCGKVYCFHVVRTTVCLKRFCVRNVLFL